MKWKDVCKPKHTRLWILDLCVVNVALLFKWGWSLILDMAFYEIFYLPDIKPNFSSPLGVGYFVFYFALSRCKEMSLLGLKVQNVSNWFVVCLSKNVGSGLQTSFWKDRWVGLSLLDVKFPRLFVFLTHRIRK